MKSKESAGMQDYNTTYILLKSTVLQSPLSCNVDIVSFTKPTDNVVEG